MRSGVGRFLWINGDTYEGAFVDDKMNGVGKFSWPNGETYWGEYKDG